MILVEVIKLVINIDRTIHVLRNLRKIAINRFLLVRKIVAIQGHKYIAKGYTDKLKT